MKEFIARNKLKLIMIVLCYLVSIAICILILTYIPYWSHRTFLHRALGEATQWYTEKGSLEGCELYGMGVSVYNDAGDVVYYSLPEHFFTDLDDGSFSDTYVSEYVGKVAPGRDNVFIKFVPKRNLQFIILARNIDSAGGRCTFFLIRDLYDSLHTLTTVRIFYTVIYFLGAAFFIYTIRKSQKLDKKQRDYLANFSHDLKSPISSIRILAEAMQARLDPSDNESHHCFDVIISESYCLEHTVKDILELSSLQNNKDVLSKSKVRLQEIFAPIFDKYQSLAEDMMIDFNVGSNFADLPPVNTNGKNLTRIMEILIDNAFKFMKFEGIINISFKPDSQKVTVCVQDNGIGISKEDQRKIFDRFYMSDRSHNTKGSGLGLSIAKEIIDGLGEKIWVESEPGKGSSFFFTVHF